MSPSLPASCPIPFDDYPRVMMAHGGGGRLMRDLIAKMFHSTFGSGDSVPHDAALLEATGDGKLAFTTDSYVVRPMFFPGGDLGAMAVHGTVNDLAMAGAKPVALSAGFIIEEGLPMDDLWKITCSMQAAAEQAGVRIVTGDTKVVDRGKGDGLYLNTAGVGVVPEGMCIHPMEIRAGDRILTSGDLGRHGMAIMSVREGLAFETAIESDSGSVAGLVEKILGAGVDVHCLRDLTRGGLTGALNEIALDVGLGVEVVEDDIPVDDPVRTACEILGLDPMQVACEGRFAAFVPPSDAEKVLQIMRSHPMGQGAADIGEVREVDVKGRVVLLGTVGARRILDLPSGEQLPRIC